MFTRKMHQVLLERLSYFPTVLLTGPRQSGKTTLLKNTLKDYDYINLESPDELALIKEDPRAYLEKDRKKGLIIDEAQKYPELFSYIQTISDDTKKKGQFILSGSQNFLLNQQVSQSLAGRTAILELLPLTYAEFSTNPILSQPTLWSFLQQGAYPRPYQESIPADIWMDAYVQTYIERDVRDLLRIKDLGLFTRFLRLCAGRHGQLLNQNQLALEAGVSHTTVAEWLSILEASYILFQLQPYHKNFNKRLVKSRKLYFYDAGLVCYLLGIKSPEQLSTHVSRGAIFEGFVIAELKKCSLNKGERQPMYFWRDSNGTEIDLLLETDQGLAAIEIKSTSTFRSDLLKTLKKWPGISDQNDQRVLVYAGDDQPNVSGIKILSWTNLASLQS